ncbi:hypothetical protein TrST_g2658 [Triparma strigata]|uniref:BART domain-containing protein n=1 Tax=Triparma strigata TaxID=1606541 RepID=A0A9W7BQY3_9STRA|nr:hypothetical protein TrST_g2658 [Triparma strigata]
MESKSASSSDSEDDYKQSSNSDCNDSKQTSSQDSPASLDPHEVIRLTSEYFYLEDDLSETISDFITSPSNLDPFRLAFESSSSSSPPPEFPLECHSIYTSYLSLMESSLLEFITSLSLTMSQFVEALSSVQEGIENGEFIATGFSTLCKFESYVEMVRMFVENGVEPCFVPPLVGEDGRLEYE